MVGVSERRQKSANPAEIYLYFYSLQACTVGYTYIGAAAAQVADTTRAVFNENYKRHWQ